MAWRWFWLSCSPSGPAVPGAHKRPRYLLDKPAGQMCAFRGKSEHQESLVPAQAGTSQERLSRRLVASFGSLRPAGVGFDVILRRALDQRHDLILDRFNRGHRGMPLRPVPFDQRDAPMPIVIGAA